ncbi:hypothetical protein BX257_4767 [Streptomyces sp. 3212.3]|uniref:hypothetical protein n=1 Tax=Streptomyces sp. 3212.3 TaxID=1938846 RepID=UPI000E365A24|nr:hypothetical protein [Streptomyces sp. 3212.3]REE62154.1 hypothetical protein BX257_4767 [Streptomyces sp. 3212.3]
MILCGLCGKHETEWHLCPGCKTALGRQLGALPALFKELPHFLVPPQRGVGELLSSAPAGPRSPLNEDVLDLVDHGHIVLVLEGWRADVQRLCWPGTAVPRQQSAMDSRVELACCWLELELDWIAAEYPAAGDLAREVGEIDRQVRSIVGDPEPRSQRIGLCAAVIDSQGTACSAVLHRLPDEGFVRCQRCGTTWPPSRWLALANAQQSLGAKGVA